jgi:putative ABC transport system permease protein
MLKNYIKIAMRSMVRSKVYSLINIAGLSIGISCCLLLALYLQDEMQYDRHHTRLEDLYRIDTHFEKSLGFDDLASASPPIAMALRDEVPEVETAVRVLHPLGVAQSLVRSGEKVFYETDGYLADSTLFEVFSIELKEGNPTKALTDANTVVISDKLAFKLFGNEPALDQSVGISEGGDEVNYKITGVFLDNKKTFLHASYFTSMYSEGWGEYVSGSNSVGSTAANEWAGQNFVPTYVRLAPGHDVEVVNKKINDVLQKHGAESMKVLGLYKTLFLEPVKDIYLNAATDKNPRITYLYVILSIAIFILLIACINFMNLSTAKAAKRATEIGVRKVMGAFRSVLIRQILGEAMVIVSISILFSIAILQLALPYFNAVSGKSIAFNSGNILYFAGSLAVVAVITGLLAGSYPAFYISSFEPAEVLKGKFKSSSGAGRLRQCLVVFQFVIAIVMVCGMLIITKQLSFMRQQDLGFDSKAKIVLPLRTGTAQGQYEALKQELSRNSSIEKVSGTQYIPGLQIFNDMMFYTDGGNMDNAIDIMRNRVDAGYLELMGIKLIAGRTFTDNRATESQSKVIINRSAAKRFGMEPEKIVGQKIHFDWQGVKYSFDVTGVMEDYNQLSLKNKILPTLFEVPETAAEYRFLVADISSSEFNETISEIESTWKHLISDTPFEYDFLEDNIQKLYEDDQKMSQIITSFTVVALLISCLGLYGLSMFMAERRFKEIGVRKVMGASIGQIVRMMSVEFLKLVLLAFVLAVPLAWYVMRQWLEGFAYRIDIDASVFAYAGIMAVAIALLTVSYQSVRAASSNPVVALRNE